MAETEADPLGCFGRYLSAWVVLTAVAGVLVGYYAPSVPEALDEATVAQISVPVAVLIWIMVFPMLVQIDAGSLRGVWSNLKPVAVTSSINYLVQPFAMYGLARLFFNVVFADVINDKELEDEYVAGSVILGGSPCTAMVFVWSLLVDGDGAYTLVQVAFNDLLIFVFYIPTLMLLLQVTNIRVPWDTAFLSLILFMLIPGLLAMATRYYGLKYHDEAWLQRLVARFKGATIVALLATLFLIFTFQGEQMVENPLHVLLIGVPLLLQSVIIFAVTYGLMYRLHVPHRFAAPGALIATSNFFELAVAVAMSLFGADSGATLATVVGVLEEVPIMLVLVWFCNRTRHWFPDPATLTSFFASQRGLATDIPPKRQLQLQAIAEAVQLARQQSGADVNVLFLDRTNGRASQLYEVWLRFALAECPGSGCVDTAVRCFSAGIQASHVDADVCNALRRGGLVVRPWRQWSPWHSAGAGRFLCTSVKATGQLTMSPPLYSKSLEDSELPSTNLVVVVLEEGEEDSGLGKEKRVQALQAKGASVRTLSQPPDLTAASSSALQLEQASATVAREMLFLAAALQGEAAPAAPAVPAVPAVAMASRSPLPAAPSASRSSLHAALPPPMSVTHV